MSEEPNRSSWRSAFDVIVLLVKQITHPLALLADGLCYTAVTELRQALAQQKRLDLFDIQCQRCGGLGVEADYERPYGMDERSNPTFYGKRCEECDGLGSPRG